MLFPSFFSRNSELTFFKGLNIMKKIGKKHIIAFAAVTVAVLAAAAFSFRTGNNAFSNAVGTVFSPVQSVVTIAVNGVKRVAADIASSGKNAKENKELREEILSLNKQIRMLEGYKTENERLRELISLNETRTDFKSVGANVIGRKTDELHSVITLDKGTKDGVKKNSVVYIPEGLIGVVSEAGVNYCKVKTVFDPESSVSAVCPRSSDMGIVESTGSSVKGGQCSMNYIDRSAKTVVGDIIETSGTGGVFPRGIVIGKISEIKEDSRGLTLSAVIETEVDIYKLDSVLVEVK